MEDVAVVDVIETETGCIHGVKGDSFEKEEMVVGLAPAEEAVSFVARG